MSLSNWSKKVPITVPAAQVAGTGTYTGFSFQITDAVLPSTIFSNTKSDGSDIRASSDAAGNTELPVEVSFFDQGTSKCVIWVKADISADTDTTLYVWYGNASAPVVGVTDTYGRNAVWSDFLYRSHDIQTDSSGNCSDLQTWGTPDVISNEHGYPNSGMLYNVTAVEGSYTDLPAALTPPYSLGVRTMCGSGAFRTRPIAIADTAVADQQIALETYNPYLDMVCLAPSVVRTPDLDPVGDFTDTWIGFSGTVDASSNGTCFTDFGGSQTKGTSEAMGTPSNIFRMSHGVTGDTTPYGQQPISVSEAWLISGVMSDEWLQVTDNSLSSPATFVTAGAEEDTGGAPSSAKDIRYGTGTVDEVYYGSTLVDAVYYGTTLVHEKG